MATDKIQDIKNRFEIVGNAPALNRALEVAMKVAVTDMNVLVIGESGVGKENFSKIIHSLSKRKHNNFIAINCGALPEGTIDSELFGHEKGSFTSAVDTRKGYFETVDGGTIFLDEIGELPLETQSRLLRILESGEFLKVGSSKVQKTDVRLVAATNRELLDLAQKGRFREDLYYRLSTVTIQLPPLRERPEDIPMLWAKFSSDLADRYRVPPLELSPEAMILVQGFPWPGNIRQLKNLVEQVFVLETDRVISGEAIAKYLPAAPRISSSLMYTGQDNSGQSTASYQERELMYKFLYDIRREISDLRSLVLDMMKGYSSPNTSGMINPNSMDFSGGNKYYDGQLPYRPLPASSDYQPASSTPQVIFHADDSSDTYDSTIDTESTPVSDSLSLSRNEKDLIERALTRHRGKRRQAASELGISERTLYRKIKEYNIEE